MVLGEATAQSEREVLAPGQRVGDHLVVRSILGQGGTAIVYEALHTRLGAPVALKVLEVEEPFARDAALRLQREAEVCANLDDPHVPRIYDVGALADGTPYLVMEKISGDTLEHMLVSGPLSLRVAAAIADDLLRGLEAVHRAGVVHRDIKPANLMIKLNPEGGAQVRLMDFGVSKSIAPESSDPKLTRMGTVVGTPHYMAPEQITADAVDARADLYAAGVVLYEMLSGRTPYEGDTTAEVVAAVLRGQPPPLRRLVPRVPPPVAAVVMRAMAAAPRDRFPTAREMRLALAEALRGRPPMLRLGPEPERVRHVRRSRAPLWVAACVGVGTLVGAAFWPGSVEHNLGGDGSPAPVAKAKEQATQGASAEAAQARWAASTQGAQDPAHANGAAFASAPPQGAEAEPLPDTEARDALPASEAGEAARDLEAEGEEQGASLRYGVGLAGKQRLALDMPDPKLAAESEAESDAVASKTRSRARAEAEDKGSRASTRVPPPASNVEPVGRGIELSDYLRHLDAIRQELVELPESHGLPPMAAEEPVPPNPYAE